MFGTRHQSVAVSSGWRQPIISMFCATCGTGSEAGARFCKSCGAANGSANLVPIGRRPVAVAPPVFVNITTSAPQSVAPVVIISDGHVLIGASGGPHLTTVERLTIAAAIGLGMLLALMIPTIRLALMVLLPLVLTGYLWWLFAGEPRRGRMWTALANRLPGTDTLSRRRWRAAVAALVGGAVWLAIFLINQFAASGTPAPGVFT
jgi:hypothetical protein